MHAPRISRTGTQLVGCSCGWKPAPGEQDPEYAYTCHVGAENHAIAMTWKRFPLAHLADCYLVGYQRYVVDGHRAEDMPMLVRACDAYGREAGRRVVEHQIPHPGHWFEDRSDADRYTVKPDITICSDATFDAWLAAGRRRFDAILARFYAIVEGR